MTPLIDRVYDLKVAGYDDSIQKVKALTKAFAQMDEQKRKLNEQLQKKIAAGDAEAVTKLTAQVKALQSQMDSLSKKRDASAKEAALMAKAEKDLAAANLLNTKSIIEQEKEIDRLIDREEKKAKQDQKTKNELKAMADNYYALIKAQRDALEQYRITPSTSPFFDQVKKNAIDAKAKVDAFNRSLSPDGTLVGEYKTGIINAFKELGLGDFLNDQKNDIQNKLQQLINKNRDLANEYKRTASQGGEAFEKIDRELKESIQLQQQMEANLQHINTALAGTGSIGKQITQSLSNEFKNLKQNVAQLLVGYVGFQAVVSGVSSIFNNTVKLDSFASSLKLVSENEEQLAINTKFLKDTTNQLGLEYISTAGAFKNFYAASTQAGISADETRRIFFSTSTAISNLKLSQEDANGVLTAFSQIASKGKVQAEELRGQIGERIPGAFSIAAKAIGVTQQELNKMLENGQVLSSEFLPKFASELQKTFGGDTSKKVEGLQASINSLKNKFTELITENQSGLTVIFNIIVGFAAFMLKSLPVLIPLLSLWAIGWASLNRQLILNRTIVPILTTLFGGAENATKAWAFATNLLTRAQNFLLTALRNPYFRIFATVLGTLALTISAFASAVNDTVNKIGALGEKQRFLSEAMAQANKEVAATIAKENVLLGIIKDRTLQDQVRTKALEDLKKIMGEYGEALTLENVLTEKGTKAIKDFNEQLLKKAQISAAVAIAERESLRLSQLLQYQRDIATARQEKGSVNTSQFNQDFLEKFYDLQGRSASKIGNFIATKIGVDFTYSGKDLEDFAKLADREIKIQLEKVKGAELAKFEIDGDSKDKPAGANSITENVFQRFKKLITTGGTEADIEQLKKDITSQKAKFNVLSKDYKDLVQLEKDLEDFLNPKKQSEVKASKLTGPQKDAFKDIDAIRDEQIAKEKLRFSKLEIDEITYLQNVLRINEEAADKKLKILAGKNAEERKQIAELKLFKIEQEQETSKGILEIQSGDLQRQFDDQKRLLEDELNAVTDKPGTTELDKLKAKEKYLSSLQVLQAAFNTQMDSLEKQHGVKSAENEKKRADILLSILRELYKTQTDILITSFATQERLEEENINRIKNGFRSKAADQTTAVLNDNSLGDKEKARRIRQIEAELTRKLLEAEEDDARNKLKSVEEQEKAGLKTATDVNNAKMKLKLAELALVKYVAEEERTVMQRLTSGLKDAFNNITAIFKKAAIDKKQIEEAYRAAGEIIKQTINDAKAAFFENQRAQVDREKEVALERLNLQQQQLEEYAQSEQERESIRRQYDEKRKAEEKRAGEEKKKIALKELALNFAVAVVKTLAAYPFPFSLLPVAGLTIQYLLQKANVQAQQFAGGGIVKAKPLGNGMINDSPNIPQMRNGDNIIATVRRGEVILNEAQQRRAGGAAFFRSIGVPGFASGGVAGFDFSGNNLQPPQNTGSFLNRNGSNDLANVMKAINEQTKNINTLAEQTNRRIDKIKVEVSAKEVVDTDTKTKKASVRGKL